MEGDGAAMEIINEPAQSRIRFHPDEKLHNLIFREVMRKKRAGDHIYRLG